jgi:hypothetical protein
MSSLSKESHAIAFLSLGKESLNSDGDQFHKYQ